MSLSLLFAAALATASCSVQSPPQRVALVELYTSQGCSSCPPADRWLAALPREFRADQVLPVALHVGYWDYIGWKDPFARREFNDRQRRLAKLAGERSVYTPGVFVDGRPLAAWADGARFAAAVAAIQARPAGANISLTVEALDTQRLALRVAAATAAPAGPAELYVAVLHSGLATDIQAGENRGATLRNDHVARDWSGPHPLGAAQRLTLALPAGATPSQLSLLAFVQDGQSGQVLQAVGLPLAGCAR
jgi:hypothetical protein